MNEQLTLLAQGTGAAIYFRLGFCPAKVLIQGDAEEDAVVWTIDLEAGYGIESIDASGITELTAATGITLVKFEGDSATLPTSAPTAVEPGRWWEANGIGIGASAAANVDGNPFTVQAFRMNVPLTRAVHDGTSGADTYFEDSSIDFLEAGVSPNGKFMILNENNDNIAYIGKITKPSGQSNYSRIYTYEDAGLVTATAAADFVTGDVIFIIPSQYVQYPLITLMT